MERLPFDPAKMTPRATGRADAPKAEAVAVAPDHLSVSQLAVLIDRALRDHLPARVRVVGEIGQFRERTHWYFDLKDAEAVVSCVMFASAARKSAGFIPRQGLSVVATGRIEYYAKQGRTQFMVDRLEPVGAGALDLEFRRLSEELRSLGWFEESRKRPLPGFPLRVAVVTSKSGAALQDVLDTLRRRSPWVEVGLVDVRVQGEGAAAEVARAVRRLGERRRALRIDAIIVTRGGGSIEDLWAFNERTVAEAIVNSPIPVVAAIGHETDVTIAELVADLRCATPTQAAMRVAPDGAALRAQLGALGATLAFRVERHIRHGAQRVDAEARHLKSTLRGAVNDAHARLERLAGRLERHRPGVVYAQREARLNAAARRLRAAVNQQLMQVDFDELGERLHAAWSRAAERRESALDTAARGLDLVGPHSVLRRGFSMTFTSDGRAVRSASQVGAGDLVRTRLGDGEFASKVTDERPQGSAPPTPDRHAARRAGSRQKSQTDSSQLGLFQSP